jgi:hypothetical protein
MSVLNRKMFRKPQYRADGTGITAYFGDGGFNDLSTFNPENVKKTYSSLQELYAPLIGEPRSMQELIAERAKILGPLDNETSFNTALARAGAAISKAGSLSAGLAPAAQAFTETVSESEEKNKQLQRQVALSALDQLTRERETTKQGKLSILGNAVQQEEARIAAVLAEKKRLAEIEAQQSWESTRDNVKRIYDKQDNETKMANDNLQKSLDRINQRDLKGLEIEAEKQKTITNFNNDLAKQQTVTFISPKDVGSPSAGFSILGEYKQVVTPQGTVEYRNIENNSPLPAGALKFDAQIASVFTPKFGEPKKAFVPDPANSFTGLRAIQFQTDSKGNSFMLDPKSGEKQPMPSDAIIADQTEMFKTEFLPNGQTRYSITQGPYSGKTVFTDSNGNVINPEVLGDKYVGPKVSTTQTTPAAPVATAPSTTVTTSGPDVNAQALVQKDQILKTRPPAIGEITGQGSEGYLIEAGKPSSTKSFNLDPTTTRKMTEDLLEKENLQRQIDETLKTGAGGAVGVFSKLKSAVTNGLDPIIPGIDLAYPLNENNKLQLQNLQNKMIAAFAQNGDRVAVQEMERIRALAPDPNNWIESVTATFSRLGELSRINRNSIEGIRAQLEDRTPLYLKRVPIGNSEDPFTVQHMPFIQSMIKEGNKEFFAGKLFKDNNGKVVPMVLK